MDRDTIYALSSGALPAGVAVIRLTGPATASALVTLAGTLPEPRKASLRTIRNRNGIMIDSGLILFFPGPNSFTGEDCGELQIHGGRAVVQALLDELAVQPRLRLATEGEFSRRAFANGRLDLVEVEGLADLIAAETEMQRRLAVEHSSGGLSKLYDSWAERLTRARALIEAELDFADEEDVPGSVAAQVWPQMETLRDEIAAHLKSASSGEIIRDGFKVVIAGAPNAGKSSLMNTLARRDVAIVTDIPGTTRDVLEVDLDIAGFLVKLFDTAGLRDTVEIIEREGIRRATRLIEEADLILYLHDLTSEPGPVDIVSSNARTIHVGTKLDLNPDSILYDMRISTASGKGVPDLLNMLESHLKCAIRTDSLAIPSRLRHKDSLAQCLAAIGMAVEATDLPLDLRTEELRAAGNALGRITGRVDVENLLDVIFSEFCIGK